LVFNGWCLKLTHRTKPPRRVDILILNDMFIIVMEKNMNRGKEVKHKLSFEGLIPELLEMPIIIKNELRAVNGLRLSSITETIGNRMNIPKYMDASI
jgi:hypothetical protein